MKIKFDNEKDYIEITKREDKVIIAISAIDGGNSLNTIVNSAELTRQQFEDLIKSLT